MQSSFDINGNDYIQVLSNMGKLTVVINDDLDKKFRVAIAENGGKHGDLKVTIEEVIKLWLIKRKKIKL